MKTKTKIKVVGGGLAGSEAAYQLVKRGYGVELYEMRPKKNTPAHTTGGLAELVCSNSLKSTADSSAQGVLKTELEAMDSLILRVAKRVSVPAGAALAVDRERFSEEVEKELNSLDSLTIIREEITEISEDTVIATGPLTSDKMAEALRNATGGDFLSFFDAVAPIVTLSSVDMEHAFWGARYQKGEPDYLNCPMDKEEYEAFVRELLNARRFGVHDVDKGRVFESCMPVEVMAARGVESLRFGPMRPVGLKGKDGRRPYAALQLRQEDEYKELVNLVGFQTNLAFPEQERVFGMIPALKNAEFVRYGKMHRNTYLNAPKILERGMRLKGTECIFVAGQLSGVEGYMESVMSGLLCAVNVDRVKCGLDIAIPPETTVSGGLMRYLSAENRDFQPMHVSFELVPPPDRVIKDKTERKRFKAARAAVDIKKFQL